MAPTCEREQLPQLSLPKHLLDYIGASRELGCRTAYSLLLRLMALLLLFLLLQHPSGYEASLDPWLQQLWAVLRQRCPLPPGVTQVRAAQCMPIVMLGSVGVPQRCACTHVSCSHCCCPVCCSAAGTCCTCKQAHNTRVSSVCLLFCPYVAFCTVCVCLCCSLCWMRQHSCSLAQQNTK
jgi:hypothetical protein